MNDEIERVVCPIHKELFTSENLPELWKLVQQKRLSCTGQYICDHRVPKLLNLLNGQDISCVGPNDSRCPHPDQAKLTDGESLLEG